MNGEEHLVADQGKKQPQENLAAAGVESQEQAQEYEVEAQLAGE